MHLLLIPREGTDLFHTLFASETSREVLRFYRPQKSGCGVVIGVISLGAALSLASELRWYLRRYVALALLEVEAGRYCTLGYARAIDHREVDPDRPPENRLSVIVRDGRVRSAGAGDEGVVEVWALPGERIVS
ncbi:hypothetical protein E2N92_00340 [Methanofollis formosanus]|uniref:Uncharacterized protein n=1 Tax=Methanofollis formosanus TaxID=299308 RepID=A0A8G1EE76_9EURY|nr:DUF5804 family protein [Methanofollis formosanus]QYZ77983.1 hypothetical protein E2N92_00340 [Methanofollis formosanus]